MHFIVYPGHQHAFVPTLLDQTSNKRCVLISGEKANILIGKVWDSWVVIVLFFVY